MDSDFDLLPGKIPIFPLPMYTYNYSPLFPQKRKAEEVKWPSFAAHSNHSVSILQHCLSDDNYYDTLPFIYIHVLIHVLIDNILALQK